MVSPSFALVLVARAWGLGEAWEEDDDSALEVQDRSEAA